MNEVKNNSRWWLLAAMGAILGVILLDETVIAVALPSIQRDLGVSTFVAHWFVNIYLLVLAVLACAAGRFADIIGARSLLISGLVIFGVASTYAGFAADGADLLGARLVQGIGAACIFPLTIFVITMSFPEEERGMALGIYGAIGTCLLALGPLIGGLLTEYLSWRWIFWVNPLIVLLVAVIVWIFWRDPPQLPKEPFDLPGLVLLLTGLSALVFGIMQAQDGHWADPAVALPVVGGLILLALLVIVEKRKAIPLIAVDLFANPAFTAYNLIIFAAQFSKMAIFIFGAIYLQNTLGVSPIIAGAALLPSVVPQIFTSPLIGKTTDTKGPRAPALIGVLGVAVGIAIMAAGSMLSSFLVFLAGLLVLGLVMPALFIPPQNAILFIVKPEMRGQASGLSMTCQLMGGTVGMAICSTIYASTGSASWVFWVTAGVAFAIFVYALVATRSPAVD